MTGSKRKIYPESNHSTKFCWKTFNTWKNAKSMEFLT